MGVLELIQQKAFLGKEFLTWLWFRAETDPVFAMDGDRSLEVEILGPITLDAQYGDARTTVLKGESPATSPEAATAVLEGKKLHRVRLKLSGESTEWIATLDAETLSFTGLAVPRSGPLPFEEALHLRLAFVSEFEAILSELFNLFLEPRLDDELWNEQLKRIHAWAEDK